MPTAKKQQGVTLHTQVHAASTARIQRGVPRDTETCNSSGTGCIEPLLCGALQRTSDIHSAVTASFPKLKIYGLCSTASYSQSHSEIGSLKGNPDVLTAVRDRQICMWSHLAYRNIA